MLANNWNGKMGWNHMLGLTNLKCLLKQQIINI